MTTRISIYILFYVIYHANLKEISKNENFGKDDGPLFLTPLIRQKRIQEARLSAKVDSDLFFNIVSYSGYLTVDERFNSNLFFWFFPAEEDYKNAPVLLWLQGGPGSSSLYGLFYENGPFKFNKASTKLELNRYSWSKNHSVIYIDNPVHVGFSFTEEGFAKNQTKVGKDLYQALKQFFTLFPELQQNEFYIAGQSYAGKYIPAVSRTILQNNLQSNLKINLQGILIGNGLCDPKYQVPISDTLYQIGLIDSTTKQKFAELEEKAVNYIKAQEFRKAYEVIDYLLLKNQTSLFTNVTGFNHFYNFLSSEDPHQQNNMLTFLEQKQIRKAIHVGYLPFNSGNEVKANLIEDMMDSVAPWIEELLSSIRVLFYNGQLDIIVPYPTTEKFLENLNFSGSDNYKTAMRRIWYHGDDIAGYVKEAGNLTEVLVRNAGHKVPEDQPEWSLDLISKFVRKKSLY